MDLFDYFAQEFLCENLYITNYLRKELPYNDQEVEQLSHCLICPRECGVNRFEGAEGYCKTDSLLNVASVCLHKGEEPPISGQEGICNVFFAGCNLRCSFCQNFDISRQENLLFPAINSLEKVLESIIMILDRGINMIGFVSPSHVIPQMKLIIRELNSRGYYPVTVYNTGSYDKQETIDSLDGIIDIYLPDLKYYSPELSGKLSDASDYYKVSLKALKRMYYQKGSVLRLDDNGLAESGILIRHLILPGCTGDSIRILEEISDELSAGLSISLMSQYNPTCNVNNDSELGRRISSLEYKKVADALQRLGFRKGYFQEMDSFNNYTPDFSREHPFEH